ncbi:hypothetical protein FOA52_011806 [Chlamydomonas sp. UWO 241]|nr:hypothetical protein FOA52_011806 [Chlamydomonas sp. UWO 241]
MSNRSKAVQNVRRCIYMLLPEAHPVMVEYALCSPLFASVVSGSQIWRPGRFVSREVHHDDIELAMEAPSFVPRSRREQHNPFCGDPSQLTFRLDDRALCSSSGSTSKGSGRCDRRR